MSANDGDMKMRVIVVEGQEMRAPKEDKCCEYTLDGSVDIKGRPAVKGLSGGWLAGGLILVNQGLATLAFFGVNVNLVLFLTRVLGQSNGDAANNVSKWTGTVYMFSLIGAFLSDSYWGRYKTCAIFQAIFVLGLALLSVSSHLYLISPVGCGTEHAPCGPHSGKELGIFYIALYMIAFGNGGYQPNVATFGADQFDEEDPAEAHSKVSFFSYFYLALNLGSLFSNTFLSYLEDKGSWALGFWASTAAAATALLLFLSGTLRYRYFQPSGNSIGRICQVAFASCRNWKASASPGVQSLYESDEKADASGRKLPHTEGFSFLDRAAHADTDSNLGARDPWKLCTVTQVEEVKSILRLLPIWLCTILYSVVFTQMASLFVVQGAAMRRTTALPGFSVPPSSMSAFDILTVAATIFLYRRAICPFLARLTGRRTGPSELQRMGLGLVVGALAMATAGTVEHFRKTRATTAMSSDLHIIWQVPQYALIGVSEVMMYVGQLEFFNSEMPDRLKSFGSALCMMSMSLGNYFSDVIVSAVTKLTTSQGRPGWIPADLNEGHLDKFYFMLAVLAIADFAVYLLCASRYRNGKVDGRSNDVEKGTAGQVASLVYV
ncbi:protein NRT1/ PTR FAMILY 7.2-like [Phragmites australis]|uniref:protein NRT1/ PTR FAMILY 7.2-like n=1 Tax=Phragmites australis TaxID=29695 RepID=UPI002D794CE1|nr:protein NRT1/ PTR FAMILY 7.2-like [Phragmites australis]